MHTRTHTCIRIYTHTHTRQNAIEAAHRTAFSASTPGAFALNRLVMSGAPGAAAAYAARARALGLPALARGASAVLVALPGGVVLEIADAEAGASEASAA